jgi:CheY-like chemotaxis protein
LQETLETTTAILDEAIEAARSLTIDLYPPVLQEAGLISALGWLASRMRKKHRFTIDLHADDGAEPSSDDLRFLLFECARELLLNVVKHSGVQKANVELVRTDDSKIKLIVRDSGKGFDTLLIAKRAQADGTFGLFSIQQRIEHLGGRMEIETESGRGTEVALTVPASKREPSPAEQLEAKPEMGDSNITDVIRKPATCRIIVVDDHEVVREGLVRIIKSYPDIEIVGKAADGPQAIELAEKLKPDVVLMDVSLGEMSGIEATRRIVETNPHIKVVGLSMSTDNEVSKAMCEAGAVAHLTKSTAAAELVETIRRCARKATS